MTKKDYKAFAAEMAIQYRNWSGHPEALHAPAIVQEGMEQIFARDNPRFDQARFDAACHAEVKP